MIGLRRHVHRGAVLAVGFVIEPAQLGEAEARRRVLAWWTPGCDVRGVDGVWIVRLAAPRRIAVHAAPGAPLVELDGVLTSVPLTSAQRQAARAGDGAVVIARAGSLVVLPPRAGVSIDPAAWLAIEELTVLTASPLSPPPPPPDPVVIERDVRTVLGVAPPSEDAVATATALSAPPAPAGEADTKGPWWARAVRSVFGGKLRERASRAIYDSQLGRLIGQRHADYLRETLEMFDRGQLDEALRRAIPLGTGDGGGGRISLGIPAPRTNLRPNLSPPTGEGSAIPVERHAMDLLRDRYEMARDKLVRDGRFEEAAFVVADLLGDPEAAVALLERHGLLRLAAELAEARNLAPGLVVRQWFVAGEGASRGSAAARSTASAARSMIDRAIVVAWRTGAFSDALARLRGSEHEEPLRVAWATALADAGDYLGAIGVARGAPGCPIDAWIDRGIAAGGEAAARLWLLRLERSPERFPEVRTAVVGILEGESDEGLAERIAIARGLEVTSGDGVAVLARVAARTMLAEVGRGADGEPAVLLPKLVRIAGDATLRADMPTLGPQPRRFSLVDRPLMWTRRIARADAGAVDVHDVALLPGGRLAVALGEAGVRLLDRAGKTVAQLDQPADALVVGDHGGSAIAVARRGGVRRLARVDLVHRKANSWCELAIDGWADTFDGKLWIAHRGRDLFAFDTAGDAARATWSVSTDAGGTWLRPTRDGDRWAAVAVDQGLEAWSFERFALRRRTPIPPEPAGRHLVGVSLVADTGAWLALSAAHDGVELVSAEWRKRLGADVASVTAAGRFAAVTNAHADGIRIHLCYLPTQLIVGHLDLDGAQRAAVRFADFCLVVGDDRGRVIVVDLRHGDLRRDLRLV